MKWRNWFSNRSDQSNSRTDHNGALPDASGPPTLENIKLLFQDIHDAHVHELLADDQIVKLFYIRSLVDGNQLQSDIVFPVLHSTAGQTGWKVISDDVIQVKTLSQAQEQILTGSVLVIYENGLVYAVNKKNTLGRSIDTSEQEAIMYGPKDSLSEQLENSLTLIRRRLPVPNLKSKKYSLGSLSKTTVILLYMEGIVNPELVRIADQKTKAIDFDAFFDSAHLSAFLEDHVFSVFPQFQQTDRPDVLASALSSGKLVWVVDNTPFALVAPVTFFDLFQTPEDYVHRWMVGSFLRGLRFVAFMIALVLTPIYVAVTVHHYQMIPLEMLFVLMQSRSEVPFTPLWEALLMLLTLEILKEASLRMPTKSGQTLGVVGGIVIGQAAVQAGIASNILIIFISISAIASFLVPNYLMTNSGKLIQFIFLILAAWLGMWGVGFGIFWLFIHLHGLTSLRQPYLAPLVPFYKGDWKDTIVRFPIKALKTRPRYLKPLALYKISKRRT